MSTEFSDNLCKDRYELAVAATNSFIHVKSPSEYHFGVSQGLDVLYDIPLAVEQPTVLDIGAGSGMYLQSVRNTMCAQDRKVRTIGLIASDERHISSEGIDWVFGDFQRPNTWIPKHLLPEGSVDLAVSSLTFPHFADPIRALRNALILLKDTGEIFIDRLTINVDDTNPTRVAGYIREQLKAIEGKWGIGDQRWDYSGRLEFQGAHLRKTDNLPMEEIQIIGEHEGDAVYTV